jgi:hypothetical protein
MFRRVAENGLALPEPGRYAAVIIGDKYAKGELIPLGFPCMEAIRQAGFLLKTIIVKIIVKNIEGNEKGKDSNLWRYRSLKGGFYVFKHEYILLCQKPLR